MKKFVLASLVLFVVYATQAQTEGRLIEKSLDLKIPFTVTQFSTADGLPQSQVICIIPKQNGDLILSTSNGVVEYNGNRFKEVEGAASLRSIIFTQLWQMKKPSLLFGWSNNGLHRIQPLKKDPWPATAAFVNDSMAAFIDKNGSIFIYNAAKDDFVLHIKTNVKGVRGLFYENGKWMLASDAGLTTIDQTGNSQNYPTAHALLKITQNPYSKHLYFNSAHHLYRYPDLKNPIFNLTESSEAVIQNLAFIDEQEFFIATTLGLFQMGEGYTDRYGKENTLPSEYIQGLFYNKEENCLFAGTGEKGLLKLQLKNCYTISPANGFGPSTSLTSVIKTKKNHVLVSGNCCHIYKLDIDTAYPFFGEQSTYSSLAEINGKVFAGTYGGGIELYDDRGQTGSLNEDRFFKDKNIHACFQDKQGNIWIGTDNGISVGKNEEEIRPAYEKEIKNSIISFMQCKNGNICAAGNNGVYVIEHTNHKVSLVGREQGFKGIQARYVYEDEDGKLWIGSYNGGLFCYYKGKLTSINAMKNCALGGDVFCLAKDEFGYLYITGNHGLQRVKEKDLNDFYYGRIPYLIPFHYGQESGILNTEFNGGFQNNFLRTKQNHFYFPTIEGVVIVTPEKPEFRKVKPTLDFLKVNDTLNSFSKHTFDRNTFSFEIGFSCASFLKKYNIHYQYKLEKNGENGQWSVLQKNNSVSFKLLSPGKYRFSLRCLDAFNDRSPEVVNYDFEIEPRFYERTWFFIVALILFLILTIAVGRWRVQSYRRKAEEQQRIKARFTELELKVLHGQMNPHFIFNSLNSIKYLLSVSDIRRADYFIDNFSVLLRNALEYSNKSSISIREETAFLTAYLELEKMRMNDRFSFSINTAEDAKNEQIPTFLLQPVAENSIKHGFSSPASGFILTITIKKENKTLICTIEDNGIGRPQQTNKESGTKKHKSKGIELIRERIQMENQQPGRFISFEIIDKTDALGNKTGTRVTFKISNTNDQNSYSRG